VTNITSKKYRCKGVEKTVTFGSDKREDRRGLYFYVHINFNGRSRFLNSK
jgi:hypothetical protein